MNILNVYMKGYNLYTIIRNFNNYNHYFKVFLIPSVDMLITNLHILTVICMNCGYCDFFLFAV